MIEEEIPHILGEGWVDTCKDIEKVGLECFGGMFSGVSAMDIRRDKLELDVPLLLDGTSLVRTGFVVVEDL